MTLWNPKTFVFDVDDTLVDFFAYMIKIIKEKYGLDASTFASRETHKYLNITIEEWFNKIIEFELLVHSPPKTGAIELLQRLYDEGHNIHFVTCRGFHPDAYDVTCRWLKLFIPNYEHNVHIIQLSELKSDVIRTRIGHVDYFFDDTLHHCSEVKIAFPTARCVLINMPWNAAVDKSQEILREQFSCIDNLSEFNLEIFEC